MDNPLKKCRSCGISADTASFYRNKAKADGFEHSCKICARNRQLTYYKNNTESVRAYQKQYYLENRDFIYRRAWWKNAFEVNTKLRSNLRKRIAKILNRNSKSGSAIRDLGCSVSELKIYLESKFKFGMSWDNYGLKGWHVDHIKPLASFNLSNSTEFKQATHFTNLQPLWAAENLKKGAKVNE